MRQYFALLLVLAVFFCGCQPAPEPPEEVPADPVPSTASTQPFPEPGFHLDTMRSSMTLEEKVGQLFLARCPEKDALEAISAYHLGGYILFGKDFEQKTPETVTSTIVQYQDAASIPLLIAVDEEGGSVNRVSLFPQYRAAPFPSPRALYEEGGLERILEVEEEKISLLRSLGINVNMAPVCDLAYDPAAFLYHRSLGQSPGDTAAFVRSLVETMAENQMGSVLKHFPGYGENGDTHVGFVTDPRPLESFESRDLIPFQAGMDAQCGAILVSHLVVSCLDDQLPASLSPVVIDYLRNTMGFSGVVMTDDLSMDAIAQRFGPEEAAILAVLAGNDLLCTSSVDVQYPAVLEAVRAGRISQERIDLAVSRVLMWKYQLGLLG